MRKFKPSSDHELEGHTVDVEGQEKGVKREGTRKRGGENEGKRKRRKRFSTNGKFACMALQTDLA